MSTSTTAELLLTTSLLVRERRERYKEKKRKKERERDRNKDIEMNSSCCIVEKLSTSTTVAYNVIISEIERGEAGRKDRE